MLNNENTEMNDISNFCEDLNAIQKHNTEQIATTLLK